MSPKQIHKIAINQKSKPLLSVAFKYKVVAALIIIQFALYLPQLNMSIYQSFTFLLLEFQHSNSVF